MTASPTAAPNRWLGFAILLLASFMNLIDVTIVNVAIPRLQETLGGTSSDMEWVVAGYVLPFALGLLPFGRLGDLYGRKRLFLWGLAGFTLGSAFCGLAPDIETLVAARIFQGITAAMLMPQVLALAQLLFPPQERAAAFSLFGVTAGLASVIGPLAGGSLIALNLWELDWRPIFLINIPLGLFAILAGQWLISAAGHRERGGMDLVGVLLAALAMLAVLFPLIEGRQFGWPLWILLLLAASPLLAFAFVRWEIHRRRCGRTELLPAALLGNRAFLTGIGMTVLLFSALPGFFFITAIFLQSGFGFSALMSGLTTVPFPVGILLASILSGRLAQRWPRSRIVLGALVFGGGMLALRIATEPLLAATVPELDRWLFAAPLLACGFGIGLAIAPLFGTILSNVDPRQVGSGSGALQSFQQVGGALGVALLGQIFFPALETGMSALPVPAAFAAAYRTGLVYEIGICLALAVLAFTLPRPRPVEAPPPAAVEL